MKFIHSFGVILLAFLMALPLSSEAQYRRRSSSPDHQFVLGVAPFSLLLPSGKINVHGEWAYSDNKSLSVIVGIPRPSKAPDWLADDVAISDEGRTITDEFHSFGLTVENRFYIGSNAPQGFYLAPYARYNRIWLTHVRENPDNQGETRIVGAYGGAGIGAAAGLQFRLGSNVTLDATFIGLDLKWMRGTLTYSTDDPDNNLARFRDEVQEAVEDIPLIGPKLSAEIEGNQIKVRSPGLPLPAYRFNFSVNYAF